MAPTPVPCFGGSSRKADNKQYVKCVFSMTEDSIQEGNNIVKTTQKYSKFRSETDKLRKTELPIYCLELLDA